VYGVWLPAHLGGDVGKICTGGMILMMGLDLWRLDYGIN
jgi:hypothetical protein